MKLEAIYPKPKRTTIGPHPEYYPDKERFPDLCWGGGYYDCYMCRHTLTAYKVWMKNEDGDDYYALVCSTECYEEATGTKPKWPEVPVVAPPEPVAPPKVAEPEVSKAPIEPEDEEPEEPVPEAELHPELPVHPSGEELPKPKLTKAMITVLLKRRLDKKIGT